MIGLARGFRTPLFAIFEGDTSCGAIEEEKTKLLNGKLAKLLGKDANKWSWLDTDIFEPDAIIWKNDIQAAHQADYPS